MRLSCLVIAWLLACASLARAEDAARPAVAASTSAPAASLVLDETAYCRAYVQFGMDRISPTALKAEGERILGQGGMGRLKADVYRWRRSQGKAVAPGKPPDDAEWTDQVYLSVHRQLWEGDRDRADRYCDTAPPSPGWAAPGFDDSLWLYQRAPLMVGRGPYRGGSCRAGFFRFYLDIPDPDKAGQLNLELSYAGGARVFLNGKEIARGHLPPGQLGPQVRGADYPLGAYVKLDDADSMIQAREGRAETASPVFFGEMPESFGDALPAYTRDKKEIPGLRLIGNRQVDSQTFDRVRAARARGLGPLTLPASLLRKGGNLLAIEIRASHIHPVFALAARMAWESPASSNAAWSHGQIHKLRLWATGDVPSAMKRPAGVCVWTEDMHRPIISSEFLAPGVPAAPLRLVGANNGVFSAQIVVGTDRQLTNLKITPSELKSSDGAVIPASAVKASWLVPHRLDEWKDLGSGAGGAAFTKDPLTGAAALALRRHGPPGISRKPRKDQIEAMKELCFFDHIGPTGIAPTIPAQSCQPAWVTLEVPAGLSNAAKYTGAIRVEATGMAAVEVPLEVEIFPWRIPDPRHFQANAALEQSPYGVAGRYNVPLWSDEHFKLMESSFEQLAKVGNDWVNVPVVSFTEFGNAKDSMIRWVRRPDGRLDFDYSILDRYLALAIKHLGVPKVISFVILNGEAGDPPEVEVVDEATGLVQTLRLDTDAPAYTTWKAFATSLYAHMKSLPVKGLEKSMHWGYLWDNVASLPEMPLLLDTVTPGVKWTAGAHRGTWGYYHLGAYAQLLPFALTEQSLMGWKNKDFHVLLPRSGGSVIGGDGIAFPFTFRLMVDRTLTVGLNGIGRTGADYWGDTYAKGLRKHGWRRTGMPNHFMLWPGQAGAEPSARFMAMREGYQESEARIFLEQLLDRKLLPDDLTARAKDVLFEHHRQTLYIPSVDPAWEYVELCRDWQARSQRLFEAAAQAAHVIPLDLDRRQITVDLPARGQITVAVKLRGWSAQPRSWRADADQPWIMPARISGTLAGHEDLRVALDAAGLKPGATVTGTLTITDTATGRTSPVSIGATVTKVIEFVPPDADRRRGNWKLGTFFPHSGMVPVNVAPGKSGTSEVMVSCLAGTEIAWKAEASAPWLKIEPSSGKVPPETPISVKLTATPPDMASAYREAVLTFSEANGPASVKVPVAVHVIPEYVKPTLPAGKTAVSLAEQYKDLLKAYNGVMQGYRQGKVEGKFLQVNPRIKGFSTYIGGAAPYEAIFNIEGKGFTDFSVQVGFLDLFDVCIGMWGRPGPSTERVNYEIWVDGTLRTQSAFMGPKDDFRLLVVSGLENAKELRLVARSPGLPTYPLNLVWCDPTLWK